MNGCRRTVCLGLIVSSLAGAAEPLPAAKAAQPDAAKLPLEGIDPVFAKLQVRIVEIVRAEEASLLEGFGCIPLSEPTEEEMVEKTMLVKGVPTTVKVPLPSETRKQMKKTKALKTYWKKNEELESLSRDSQRRPKASLPLQKGIQAEGMFWDGLAWRGPQDRAVLCARISVLSRACATVRDDLKTLEGKLRGLERKKEKMKDAAGLQTGMEETYLKEDLQEYNHWWDGDDDHEVSQKLQRMQAQAQKTSSAYDDLKKQIKLLREVVDAHDKVKEKLDRRLDALLRIPDVEKMLEAERYVESAGVWTKL